MNRYVPMPLTRVREPFDHPEWIFELKYDGFRALLCTGKRPQFVSRNGNVLGRFVDVAHEIEREVGIEAILDGEIVSLDRNGRPKFYDLMFGRGGDPVFVAFDVLQVGLRDVRPLSLVERKKMLRRMISRRSAFALYADAIDRRGREFFQAVCARDLEGSSPSGSRALPTGRPVVVGEGQESGLEPCA